MSKIHRKNDKLKPGTGPRLATQSRSRARFQVVKKSEVKLGPIMYKSKWVPSRNGGLMADIRVNGRRVFLDRRGPQPKNDGKLWEFVIVAENPKQTVYFAQIILPACEVGPLKIVITKSGKMICSNRRAIPAFRASAAPVESQLAQYRHASANDKLEPPDEDDYFDDHYVDDGRDDEHDYDEEDDDYRDDDDLFDEVDDIEETLNPHHKWCFNCGFYACECDGTALELNPVRKYFANRAD
jgi:hypothetical protein